MEGSIPDPRADPRIVVLEQRIARAVEAINDLNRVKVEGQPTYGVDSSVKLVARIDAIAALLIGNGVLDMVDFTGEHLMREAESVEEALAAFTEDKRRRTGLIVPPSRNGTPE